MCRKDIQCFGDFTPTSAGIQIKVRERLGARRRRTPAT
jgi:hypothetical protein